LQTQCHELKKHSQETLNERAAVRNNEIVDVACWYVSLLVEVFLRRCVVA